MQHPESEKTTVAVAASSPSPPPRKQQQQQQSLLPTSSTASSSPSSSSINSTNSANITTTNEKNGEGNDNDEVNVPVEKAPKFEFRKARKTRAERREEQLRQRKERKEAKRLAKIEKSEKDGVVTAQELAETEYEFRNGLRCVKPYEYEYKVYAKERWVGQEVLDLFVKEFGLGREYYLSQIEKGRIRLSGRPVKPDTKIAHGDLVTNLVHRHEPPITAQEPTIIAQTDELVVVDKPSSISVSNK